LNTLNPEKLKPAVGILISFLVFFLFQSCAPVPVKPPSSPFTNQEIVRILSSFREQQKRVHTSFSSGRLTVRSGGSEYDANILIVGTGNPFKTKIEITHLWGRTLLHVLIHDARLQILSFPEKEYYLGRLGISGTSKFLPIRLDPDHVRTLVRGYPILCEHNRAISYEPNQITLLNRKGEAVQVIRLYPETCLPCLISFPKQGITISFSGFQNEGGIQYAKKITVEDPGARTTLILKLKQTVFNETIPKSIFEMKIPADFKILTLPLTSP